MIRIGGDDRRAFLQGLISNDINLCLSDKPIYAALLTPQGKFLHDMFIVDIGDAFLVDCEGDRADDLLKRFSQYKLRAKVTLENVSAAYDVWAMGNNLEVGVSRSDQQTPPPLRGRLGGGAISNPDGGNNVGPPPLTPPSRGGEYHRPIFYTDPRLSGLGSRIVVKKGASVGDIRGVDFAIYDKHRLTLGVPDGSRDMIVEKSTLLECNLDRLNAISWTKGCYMGQELTARMHYRALVKKRLFPVKITGPDPAFGSVIQLNGEDIGDMRSSCGDVGLAMLSVEKAENKVKYICGNVELKIYPLE
jgi:folate-binding protein YgfZ